MKKTLKLVLNFLKKTLKVLFYIILTFILLLYITDNQYLLKGMYAVYLKGNTTATINDNEDFYNNPIENSAPQLWEKSENYNKISLSSKLENEHKEFKTAAWVVIHNGKLYQEKYYDSYNEMSKINSFSMAKSITTLSIGKAIEDGYIKSVNEPIVKFLPEFKDDNNAQKCTIKDLTGMTSGYDWEDSYYFPIHHMTKAYYNDDLEEVIFNRKFINKPNTVWKYQSGTTQLEGFVLKRAIKKPISKYLSEKFWKPLGMENPALWSLDKENGTEKVYCCIHSNAKDFAKLGQLMLQNGNWKGKQIIDSTYVKWMKTPTTISGNHYGQTIWIDYSWKHQFYMFRGHLGQYIICLPKYDLVIVRLGEKSDRIPHNFSDGYHPKEVYIFIEETLKNLPI